jgi:hypothetical protein
MLIFKYNIKIINIILILYFPIYLKMATLLKYVNITWNETDPTPPEGLFPLCLNFEYGELVINNCFPITNWFDINGNNLSALFYTFYPNGNMGCYSVVNNMIENTYFINNTNNAVTNFFGNGVIELILNESVCVVDTDTTSIYYNIIQTITDGPCCFSEGTNILGLTEQLKEEYRLVQNLMIGDFVKSYLHGYRKVSKIISGSFVNNPKDEGVANCMYIMKKTDDNGLIEDLTLTRNHGVLVEKLTENEEKKIDKNNLPVIDNLLSIITADCDKFEKVMNSNVYKYYHFSLETDGDEDRRFGVWANGLLVEAPSNNMMDGALNVKPLDF